MLERTFNSQARWFNAKRYRGLTKTHTWHTLLAITYHLKRLAKLFAERQMITQNKHYCALTTENRQFRMVLLDSFARK